MKYLQYSAIDNLTLLRYKPCVPITIGLHCRVTYHNDLWCADFNCAAQTPKSLLNSRNCYSLLLCTTLHCTALCRKDTTKHISRCSSSRRVARFERFNTLLVGQEGSMELKWTSIIISATSHLQQTDARSIMNETEVALGWFLFFSGSFKKVLRETKGHFLSLIWH